MPRLARLRFVSVGHANARFPDLVLDLRDAAGRATDSTIWLRNGGGKSSILNLFFALIRPDRREFLGNRAEARRRRLEDYVQSDDRAVLAAEWELDPPADQLPLADEHERLITGAFYEWRAAGGADALRRLFFAARVDTAEPRLTLDGLPLFVEEKDGTRRRRTLAAFRDEWAELRNRLPHRNVVHTESQREWADLLVAAQIDPELFAYQIRMNHREGAVDELFRFDGPEEFIDFLLELTCDPALGERVGRNITAFRTELRERKHRLLPERELVDGLASRLEPIAGVAEERARLDEQRLALGAELSMLRGHATLRRETLREELQSCVECGRVAHEEAAHAEESAGRWRRRVAALRLLAAELRLARATAEVERASRESEAARRRTLIWTAAVPLAQAQRAEAEGANYARMLEEREAEHQPLLGELKDTAARLAGALRAKSEELRALEAVRRKEERDARQEAEQARKLAADARVGEADARAMAGRARELLARGAAARARLEHDGALRLGEPGSQACARLAEEIALLDRRAGVIGDGISRERKRLHDLRAQHVEASSESEHLAVVADGARRQVEGVEAAFRALGRDGRLTAFLEVEVIEATDLERMSGTVLGRLERAAQSVLERIVRLELERAADERAVVHLEEASLLPPSPGVERVRARLRERLPAAWSGWEYLAENAPDATARRAILARAPHLVAGVIVRDSDFDAAVAMLGLGALDLDEPVTVATQNALSMDRPDTARWAVFGPSSDALFDRQAGQTELLTRRTRAERLEDEIRAHRGRRAELDELVGRLRELSRQHPQGTIEKLQRTADAARRNAEAAVQRRNDLFTACTRSEDDLRALDRDLRAIDAPRRTAELHRALVSQFVEEHESHDAELHDQVRRAEADMARHVAEHDLRSDEAGRAETRADQLAVERERVAQGARDLERDREQISYAPPEPEPLAGPVSALRDAYEQLRATYEERVGREGLLELRRSTERRAAEARRRFQDNLGRDGRAEEVEAALGTLADPTSEGDAEARRDEAGQALMAARGVQSEAAQAHLNARQLVEQRGRDAQSLGVETLDADGRPATEALAEEEAGSADREVAAAARDAAAARTQEALMERRGLDLQRIAAGVERDLDRLEALAAARLELIEALGHGRRTASAPPATDAELPERIRTLDAGLREADASAGALDRRREEALVAVRRWLGEPRFEELKSSVAREIARLAATELEARAAALSGELALRAKTIDDQLNEMERHREMLVDETLDAAVDGLELVRRAAQRSRLPEHVPGLGGAHFLKIHDGAPEDRGERRGRIGELIDEMIDEGEIPGGLALVQHAVRRLARPIRVRVLNPDPGFDRQSVEISDMARFSGGEQLTGAILLYCTLAQLRARARGLARRPSSVLLLDNPIGRASRARFLELQREVARAMGVQLIYTTAVNDLEALRALPNVIRVRNDRLDRNSGYRIVEHETEHGLDAARVVRPEDEVSGKRDAG